MVNFSIFKFTFQVRRKQAGTGRIRPENGETWDDSGKMGGSAVETWPKQCVSGVLRLCTPCCTILKDTFVISRAILQGSLFLRVALCCGVASYVSL